jgi:hypothetical protein
MIHRFLVYFAALMLSASAHLFAAAQPSASQFTSGDMFRATDAGIFRIPLGGGDFTAVPPFTAGPDAQFGQFAWHPDLAVSYFTNFSGNRVMALAPDGTATPFATGLSQPTGILWTSDGRLLVAEYGTGMVKDITAGGDFTEAPAFATGLGNATRNMLETQDGRILVCQQGLFQVMDITAGGDFSEAAPFATLPERTNCIAQDATGRIWAGVYNGPAAGLYEITAGGTILPAAAYVTGGQIIGVACDAFGGIYAVEAQGAAFPNSIRDVTAGGAWADAPEYAKVPGTISDTPLSIVPGIPVPTFTVATQVLVAKGDPVPGAGSGGVAAGAKFRTVGIPALNDGGFIAFAGSWSAGVTRHGIFTMDAYDAASASVIAVSGTPIPENPAVNFGPFAPPIISETGAVAFLSSLSGVPRALQQGLFTNLEGTLQLVAQSGTPAPGTNGATFKKILSVAVGRSPGEGPTALYFTATLTPGTGQPAVNKFTDYGLWRWRGGQLDLLLRKGSIVFPGGGGEGEGGEGGGGPPISVKFFSALTPRRSGGTSTSGQGHGAEQDGIDYLWTRIQTTDGVRAIGYIDGNGNLSVPYRRGVSAPDGSGLFKAFNLPTQDVGTSGSFLAQLAGPGVSLTTNMAIFAEDEFFDLHRVVNTGDAAPGFTGGVFSKLRDPVTASFGRVSFTARVAGGGVTLANDDGIWVASDCGCEKELIAQEGTQPPGVLAGATWRTFLELALPESPFFGPIFVAQMAVPKGNEPNPAGITKANDTGFWITDATFVVHLALREGQQLQVGGVTKTVRGFKPITVVPGSPAQTRSHSSSNILVYQVVFTDMSTAIVRTDLLPDLGPGPGNAIN